MMRGNMTPEEKAAMPKITKEMVKRAASYIIPYWKQVAFIIFIIIISSVLNVFPTIISGKIIDDGFNGGNFRVLAILIGLSFGLFIFSNLLNLLQTYINAWVSQHIVFDMRNQMYRHLEFMSHRFFTTEKTGDIITRMTGDINGVRDVISNTLPSILSNSVVLITTVIAMYSKNWVLATMGIIFVPLFIIPTKKVGRKRFDITIQTQKKHDEMNQLINETLNVSGSLLVKIFTKEDIEYDKYNKINKEIIKLNLRENLIGRWFRMFIGMVSNMGPTIIYLVGGVMMLVLDKGDLTVGDITVLVGLINRLYGPVNSLLNVQIDISRSMAHFQRIFTYFDKPHEIANKPDAVVLGNMKGAIDFEGVSFYYDKSSPVLKNMTFHVESGKTVAIVGPSGAGKSTVINLIPRLYDVTGGMIKIDGYDIRDISLKSLRSNIGFVTQDSYLFNGTIKENLLYANADATLEMIEDACKKANIHDFIISLPDKYDALVGNRGLKLSGGEKQRISLARVILRDPKILILDEATSALDSISESLIQEAIEPLLRNRTSVVIAHRLSTIMAADEILVVENGQIAEQGTHHDLLAKEGTYKTLYETQFKQAIEDAKDFKYGGVEINEL
ncbi:atp-binding cassette sub-family b [Holotrichia oblita]|nr:atp-binding cassette sub-family b [Holotrichia oblita]